MFLIQTNTDTHISYGKLGNLYGTACGAFVIKYHINSPIYNKFNSLALDNFCNVSCKKCLSVAKYMSEWETLYKKEVLSGMFKEKVKNVKNLPNDWLWQKTKYASARFRKHKK